jgi:hypothetical protein
MKTKVMLLVALGITFFIAGLLSIPANYGTAFKLGSSVAASAVDEPSQPLHCTRPEISLVDEEQSCTKDSPNFCGFVPIGGPVCGKDAAGPYGSKEECERVNGKACKALCASACPAC